MLSNTLLAIAVAAPAVLAQSASDETLLGIYMFHRHGDRTAKSTPPTNLTALGYQEVLTSGEYYRSRYIDQAAEFRINGVNTDRVKQSQIAVSAPDDVVLENSAAAFLQGLYPPTSYTEVLGNGTTITAPMNGFQLIPVGQVSTGAGSEDNTWLQSASGCEAAIVSSNKYFASQEYLNLLNSTKEFYQSLLPVVNATFNQDYLTFKNAYSIFDLINVAEIHNASIQNSSVLNNDKLFQLRTLADAHEWGLAYNASDNMRAVAGMQLAGEVVKFLNSTLANKGKQKIGIQFGAYATFASFFGLAGLPAANSDFYGVSDYASAMTFEMFTNASTTVSSTNYPSTSDVYVRFLFHNGTTSNSSTPTAYPLFGGNQNVLSWSDFTAGMKKFSISTSKDWCTACGNYTGTCAAYAPSSANGGDSASTESASGGNGLSAAVNGVIGAMVTLAVVLGLEALILVLGGLRVVSKKRLSNGAPETAAKA